MTAKTDTSQNRSPRFAAMARRSAAWRTLLDTVEADPFAHKFFTKGACEWFDSHPVGTPRMTDDGVTFFLTSERFEDEPRIYHVRRFTPGKSIERIEFPDGAESFPTPEIAAGRMTDAMIAHRNNN